MSDEKRWFNIEYNNNNNVWTGWDERRLITISNNPAFSLCISVTSDLRFFISAFLRFPEGSYARLSSLKTTFPTHHSISNQSGMRQVLIKYILLQNTGQIVRRDDIYLACKEREREGLGFVWPHRSIYGNNRGNMARRGKNWERRRKREADRQRAKERKRYFHKVKDEFRWQIKIKMKVSLFDSFQWHFQFCTVSL